MTFRIRMDPIRCLYPCVCFCLLLVFLIPASAEATELEDSIGMDAFTRAAEEYLDGYLNVDETTGDDLNTGMQSIFQANRGVLTRTIQQAGRSGALLLTAAMLCGLTGTLREEFGGGGLDPSRLAGAAAVTAIAVVDVNALVGLGKQVLEQMDTFSKILLPTVTAACAVAGTPITAAARQETVLLFFGLLLTVAGRFFIPMVYAYTAACAAHAALDNAGLKQLADLLKKMVTSFLSVLLTAFVLYLSFRGAVAGHADALSQKAAKTAISGMVPVVGGILSDVAETVVAGAGVLKSTVGVVGLLAVLAICLVPFLRLGIHYLVYKCAAALAATVAPGPVSGLINDLGSAFALVLGMTGGSALILYVALLTSIQTVGGA